MKFILRCFQALRDEKLYPMTRHILLLFLAGGTFGAVTISGSQSAIAEGTKEMTANPAGYRPWFNSPAGGNLYQGITQRLIVNVYAQPGELINVGSSGIGLNAATIQLKAPNGTVYTATGTGGVGVINNRAEENAGPLPNLGGYTPYARTVLPAEAGVWQVTFISPGTGNNGSLANTTNWTRTANQINNRGLLAWDVTVRDAGGTTIPGRSYITNIGADMGNYYPNILKGVLYVLSKDGYIYQVDTNTLAPFIFNLFSNNKGFISGGNPTYRSLNAIPTLGTMVQDPYALDSGGSVTNKMFLNSPATDLPSIATYAGGGSTWLLNTPIMPIVTNFSYSPNGAGGTFSFNTNVDGSFSVELDVNNNGSFTDAVDRRIQGLTLSGSNNLTWDGKNGQGVTVNNLITFPVRIATRVGEIHFPVTDAESSPGGFRINRINGMGTPDSTIYWDDTSITKTGATSNLAGANSTSGAHVWGDTSTAQAAAFGNDVGIDTWTYVRSNFLYLLPSIYGNVFNDADGSKLQNGAETRTNAGGLNAILVDANDQVVAISTVSPSGTYSFKNVTPGDYTIQITTAAAVIGTVPPPIELPASWSSTGENLTGTADGTIDGQLSITIDSTSVSDANFGIEQLPTTNDVTVASQANPGGTVLISVPTWSGSDPEDGALGAGKSFKIMTLPTNATLYYNGTSVSAGDVIATYDPAKLAIDPIDGDVTVSFTYAAIDSAGLEDPSPATVTMPFTGSVVALPVSISGTVFEDPNYGGGAGRPLSTAGTAPQGGATVELYRQSDGTLVATTTTSTAPATLGLYTFSNVAAGDYYVRVVSSTVKSSRPGYVSSLRPVQTFRVDDSTGTAIDDGNRVGGEDPSVADTGTAAVGAVLDPTTLRFTTAGGSATVGGQAQSITPVKVNATNVTGIDFGYNFDTIVNTNDSGQGSLRQFITNANALGNTGLDQVANPNPAPGTTAIDPVAGNETSIFMIPSNQLTGGVAVISATSLLPAFTDTFTTLDGRTQTANIGDSNAGLLGVGGTVGTGADGRAGTGDESSLSKVAAPEIEIRDGGSLATGLQLQANNITIAGISIHGFGSAATTGQGDIYVVGVKDISITQNVVGATAMSFTNPTATERTGGSGIWVATGAQVTIDNNLIGFAGYDGISSFDQSLTSSAVIAITNNEFRGNATVNNISNAIELFWNGTNPTITIQGNLLANTVNQGAIHFQNNAGGTGATLNIDNNTITNSNSTLTYTQAVILNLIQDAVVRHNIIESTNNSSLGVGIGIQTFPIGGSAGNIPARRNRITQNAIYDTLKGPGIDLWTQGQPGATPRITANDGVKNLNQANSGMDYPIITSSSLTGGTLTVKGFVGNNPAGSPTFANATLEFFIADNTPADQNGEAIVGDGKSLPHGEGRTYIGTCSTDSNSKFDCSFADAGTIGLTDAKNITSTATDPEGNTSEFSAVPTVSDPNVLLVKRITAINGSTTTFAGDSLASYIDDLTNAYDDNTITIPTQPTPTAPRKDTDKWPTPNSFLIGGINGGNVKPGDEMEYTIYFLSAGDAPAKNVLFCDRIPSNVTFLPTAFNSYPTQAAGGLAGDRGIQWLYNGVQESLTNVGDGDIAQYFPPGSDPTSVYPSINCGGANTNGAILLRLGDVPNAQSSGNPINSYGFVRFRGRVK